MLCLTSRRKYISTAVGGGVHGTDAGTVPDTMIAVGSIIALLHLFIERYPQAGEMITGIIVGEGIRGTTKEYLTINFDLIGKDGKTTDIGKEINPGMSRDYRRENSIEALSPNPNQLNRRASLEARVNMIKEAVKSTSKSRHI
ncbi:MAG: hypothetical protein A2W27_04505 [Deltaproteobacteria bacterium RBG_16_44_11]|nr:MAG: hypothetical protein A2W27_04505 [Deltaproteobacteria bacterium RBG_16_44_11]